MGAYKIYSRETHLAQGQWQNVPEDSEIHYHYNNDQAERVQSEKILKSVRSLLKRIMANDLTLQQREVLSLYIKGRTQREIALRLQISQPTVSQHLNGKKRTGRHVGGAVRKLRKKVRRACGDKNISVSTRKITNILISFLDKKITRQSASLLLMGPAKKSNGDISCEIK
jgi:DNA-binding CsgD family transcriptional regulator